MYAIISIDGNSVEKFVKKLPEFLQTATPEELKQRRILPVRADKGTDNDWERATDKNVSIEADEVVVTQQYNSLTLPQYKVAKRKQLLFNAERFLLDSYEPWESIPSVYLALPAQRRQAMDSLATSVVTLVQTRLNNIKNATTHEEVAMVNTEINI